MELSEIFRIVNLVVGALMVLGGILTIFNFQLHFFIVGAYIIVFGLVVGGLEFQIPPQVSRYASFLFSFIGRGIFYIFIGSLVIPNEKDSLFSTIVGTIIGAVGIAYVIAEFIPSIEPPANMREADAGWGAEGEYTQA